MAQRPDLSVVAPVFDEGAQVDAFYERVSDVLTRAGYAWELILVDDGSTDDTFARLCALHERDPRVKVIQLARNFGHQTAISAGLDRAAGACVAIMDADLQDPPELLPVMAGRLNDGYDIAYGVRAIRKDEGWFKQATSYLFYRAFKAIANVPIPVDAGDFCVMRREVAVAITRLPERHRFLRALRGWFGFRQVGVPYDRSERSGGRTKFTWWKMLQFSLDGVLSFSELPLRFASWVGCLVAFASLVGVGVVFYLRLFTDRSIPGFATITIVVLFLGGVQLLAVGLLGEYISRIFDEVKGRPLYVARTVLGWDRDDEGALAPARQPYAGMEIRE